MFGKLLSAVIDVATLPIDVTVDTVKLLDPDRKKRAFDSTRNRVDDIQEKLESMDNK